MDSEPTNEKCISFWALVGSFTPMLFTPFRFNNGLTLKNRLVVAPMTTYSSYEDGTVRETEPPYLGRRAKGGFGLVMTAACYIHPTGHAFDGQWGCERDDRITSLKSMADALHEGGAAAFLQIHHGGRMCPSRLCSRVLSASTVPATRPGAETPEEMTEDEIWTMIDCYGQAARRAVEAGYDGVEIHGANTYLIQQFVSPHSNRREDEWGQDRLKFSREVTQRVLSAVGPNFPVVYRFSPEEPENPGITIQHTEELLEMLCNTSLSALHISLRDFRQSSIRRDFEGPVLEKVLKAIGRRKPLIGVGSVKTVADAENLLDDGCDLVALGRAAISEPEWGQKAISGDEPRLLIPAQNAQEKLTLPEGLANRIYAVPGWFDVETAEPASV